MPSTWWKIGVCAAFSALITATVGAGGDEDGGERGRGGVGELGEVGWAGGGVDRGRALGEAGALAGVEVMQPDDGRIPGVTGLVREQHDVVGGGRGEAGALVDDH